MLDQSGAGAVVIQFPFHMGGHLSLASDRAGTAFTAHPLVAPGPALAFKRLMNSRGRARDLCFFP
jgi:hypothetical protein